MLFDDGQDDGQRDVRTRVKGPVTLTHINELIERKYKSLQEKLMQEMARNAAGSTFVLFKKWEGTLSFLFCLSSHIKVRIDSCRSKFSCRVDSIFDGLCCIGKQTGSHKS